MRLDELPQELLLEVFRHLSTEELWLDVRLVCRRFNSMLFYGPYWTLRTQKRYDVHLPTRMKQRGELDPDFVEVRRSRAAERLVGRWRGAAVAFAAPTVTTTHYATVDGIVQFRCPATHKPMCVSAARDRNLILWDVEAMRKKTSDEKTWIAGGVKNAHEGWIWHVCTNADNSELYSAGWDGRLKQWHLGESEIRSGADLRIAQSTAVLSCLNDGSHVVYCSTFNAGPIACDTRTGLTVIKTLKLHGERPVFNIATGPDSHYIYSLGEDMRLAIADKRQFTVPVLTRSVDQISRMAFADGYLVVGLRRGLYRYLDPTTLKTESSVWIESEGVERPKEQHTNHLCVAPNAGALCCSYGQKIKLYTPGIAPKLFASYETDALITQISCTEDAVVCGTGLGSMRFWHSVE